MRFGTALGISVAVHAALAAGVIAYLSMHREPDVSAELDLSSVELSFADEEDSSASAQSLPTPAKEPERKEARPPEAKLPEAELPPPDPERPADLPDPKLDEPQLEPEEIPEKVEKPREHSNPVEARPTPAPAAAPRQAKVDAPPRPRKSIKPDYPRESRLRGEQGEVTLEIVVSEKGAVDEVRVCKSSGFAALDEAAVKAVRAARFTPAKSGGKPVVSSARLALNFKLR